MKSDDKLIAIIGFGIIAIMFITYFVLGSIFNTRSSIPAHEKEIRVSLNDEHISECYLCGNTYFDFEMYRSRNNDDIYVCIPCLSKNGYLELDAYAEEDYYECSICHNQLIYYEMFDTFRGDYVCIYCLEEYVGEDINKLIEPYFD